jgi:FkbM family methyltransferase
VAVIRRAVLRTLRSVFLLRPLEAILLSRTVGRPYAGLASKLVPGCELYRRGRPRSVTRYGLRFVLDRSELMQWYLYWGFVDPSHDALLALCSPGDTVVDVGGNIGITALRAATIVGPSGRVIAFEPDPENLAGFRRQLAGNDLPNVEVVGCGLAERSGTLRLTVADEHNRGMNRIDPTASVGVDVPVTTLDAALAERGVTDVAVIKIDVEGYEHHVLQGAPATLAQRPVLFVEISDDLLRAQGSSGPDLVREIEAAGYALHRADTGARLTADTAAGVHVDAVCRSA